MRRTEVQPDGCWLWTGCLNEEGYGKIGRTVRPASPIAVHRLSYLLFVGELPKGKHLDHLCHGADTTCAGGPTCAHRRCLNPAHLEPVDPAVNVARGRGNGSKTHCPAGHPYEESNTHMSATRQRSCKACRRKQQRAKYHADPEYRAKRLAYTREWKARQQSA